MSWARKASRKLETLESREGEQTEPHSLIPFKTSRWAFLIVDQKSLIPNFRKPLPMVAIFFHAEQTNFSRQSNADNVARWLFGLRRQNKRREAELWLWRLACPNIHKHRIQQAQVTQVTQDNRSNRRQHNTQHVCSNIHQHKASCRGRKTEHSCGPQITFRQQIRNLSKILESRRRVSGSKIFPGHDWVLDQALVERSLDC